MLLHFENDAVPEVAGVEVTWCPLLLPSTFSCFFELEELERAQTYIFDSILIHQVAIKVRRTTG
jgi:hypothetical protein